MHELKYLAQPFYCTISSVDIAADTTSNSSESSVQSAVDVHPGTAAGASQFTAKVTLRIANRYQHSADLSAVLAFDWTVKVNGRTTASGVLTSLQHQQQCNSSGDSSSGSCGGVQAVLQFTGALMDAHAGEESFLHVTARSVTAITNDYNGQLLRYLTHLAVQHALYYKLRQSGADTTSYAASIYIYWYRLLCSLIARYSRIRHHGLSSSRNCIIALSHEL
eukprot:15838-Heterococcus_DN1.PRE.1